ncbi:MAG: hypothetical protein RL641_569 [Candidatus Parcubacteria bacterium]|jgi:hypothetical protein
MKFTLSKNKKIFVLASAVLMLSFAIAPNVRAEDDLFKAIPQTTSATKAEVKIEKNDDKGTLDEVGDDKNEITEVEVNDDDLVAGTSTALSSAVTSLMGKMNGVSTSDYCAALDTAVNSLTVKQRASLAWYTTSYSKNLELDASEGASESEKTEYDALKSSYDKVNMAIFSDDNLAKNNKAAIRASYLDLMASYRNGTVDMARANDIRNFINKSAECFADSSKIKSVVGASATTEPQETISFSRDDLTDDDMNMGMPVAASVKNVAALKDYVRMISASDERIKSIATNETETETVYLQRGKLFGLIPLWLKVKSTVAADGTATVRYPWYKFMSSAVGGKVTSETVLENTDAPKGEKLTPADQAGAVYATMKAFMSVENDSTKTE